MNRTIIVAFAALAALQCATPAPPDSPTDAHPIKPLDAEARRPLIGAQNTGQCGDARCGRRSEGACWCDARCAQAGDCCLDYHPQCAALPLALDRIDSDSAFRAAAETGEEATVVGRSLKFIIDRRDADHKRLYFINARFDHPDKPSDAARYHYYFAQRVLPGFMEDTEAFNQATYWAKDKRYLAGSVQEYRLGERAEALYGVQFYPQDVVAEEEVLEAVTMVRANFKIPGARMAFVSMGPQQTTARVSAALKGLGVENTAIDRILDGLDFIPMNLGEAWGYLRVFPRDLEGLSASDIPVFDALPLDLTVVAATITRGAQDASAHINLKARERGTPNMVLRSASADHALLAQLDNKPVHLTVRADGFSLEPADPATIDAILARRAAQPWIALKVDPRARVTAFGRMCPRAAADCVRAAPAFGGKAAGLGFLLHPKVLGTLNDPDSMSRSVGYALAPPGVGVPVQRWFDFIAMPENASLRATLERFIADEEAGGLSPNARGAALEGLRAQILAAALPPGLVQEVDAALRKALPPSTKSVKVRSSSNAEDIAGFDGAGLYDSFRADLERPDDPDKPCVIERDDDDGDLKVKPRTLGCAIKAVYASLWNKRAVEERSFARLNHATAGMGLAIVQRYKERGKIAANQVVVTRVLGARGIYGYTFSSQLGNNVVTNPAPGTWSENVIASFFEGGPPSFSVTRYARPDKDAPPLTDPVLTLHQQRALLSISQLIEQSWCEASLDYYPFDCAHILSDNDKPTALDMEFKLYKDGSFLCKQVREFHAR